MGIVLSRTSKSNLSFPAHLRELIPRSESARLMDLVKLSGVVEEFLRSMRSQEDCVYFRAWKAAMQRMKSS